MEVVFRIPNDWGVDPSHIPYDANSKGEAILFAKEMNKIIKEKNSRSITTEVALLRLQFLAKFYFLPIKGEFGDLTRSLHKMCKEIVETRKKEKAAGQYFKGRNEKQRLSRQLLEVIEFLGDASMTSPQTLLRKYVNKEVNEDTLDSVMEYIVATVPSFGQKISYEAIKGVCSEYIGTTVSNPTKMHMMMAVMKQIVEMARSQRAELAS